MLLNQDVDQMIAEVGHDGSEILWPDLPEPMCRRGHMIHELIDLCWNHGYALATIIALPGMLPYNEIDSSKAITVMDDEKAYARIRRYMDGRAGMVVGQYAPNRPHAVAWDGERIYDPRDSRVYSLGSDDDITIEVFYPLILLESNQTSKF